MVTTVLASSDCISVRVSHPKTKLIQYSNETDFADIIYEGITPTPNFAIRLKAKFFDEDFPEENESETNSDGSSVKLLGTVKDQKQLQIIGVPYYMHKKLKRVLQHNTIYIDNLAWNKEETYDIREKEDEQQSTRDANVWLTQKNDTYVTNPFS